MKKSKIIGLSIALLGTAVSVGAAYALYQKSAEPSAFGFGAFTYTAASGDIDYLVGDAIYSYSEGGLVDESSTKQLNPDNSSVWVKVPISASYPSTEGVVAQDTIGGKLSVSVTLNSTLANASVTATTAAWVNGYGDRTWYKVDNHAQAISNTVLNSSSNTATGNVEIGVNTVATKNTALNFTNNQYVIVWISFEGLENVMLSQGGLANAYSIHLSWGAMTSTVPYVVGNANNFNEVDEFRLVPVIDEQVKDAQENNTSNYFLKWKYIGLTGFSTMKVKQGDNWIGALSGGDQDGNVQIDSAKTYNVYFKDGSTTGLEVDEGQSGNFIKNC